MSLGWGEGIMHRKLAMVKWERIVTGKKFNM